jgi:multiple antibiotic resistance protein
MLQMIKTVAFIVTTLFPIINPMGGAPAFLHLTRDSSRKERLALARRVALYSLVMLIGTFLIGSSVLSLFGITLPIVQVGGGLVVISMGWAMLNQNGDEDSKEIGRVADAAPPLHKAFYPLTMPMTVGPGTIATAITLGANAPAPGGGRLALALLEAAVASLLLSIYIFVSYAFFSRSSKLLGPNAMKVVTQLTAFLLTCIGLQIVWNGVSALIHTL